MSLPQHEFKAVDDETRAKLAALGIDSIERRSEAMIYEIVHGTPRGEYMLTRILEDIANVHPHRDGQLSKVELEVLKLIAAGNSVPSIARIRGKTANTIKTQIQRIKEKLNVETNPQAVAEGMRQGYIS